MELQTKQWRQGSSHHTDLYTAPLKSLLVMPEYLVFLFYLQINSGFLSFFAFCLLHPPVASQSPQGTVMCRGASYLCCPGQLQWEATGSCRLTDYCAGFLLSAGCGNTKRTASLSGLILVFLFGFAKEAWRFQKQSLTLLSRSLKVGHCGNRSVLLLQQGPRPGARGPLRALPLHMEKRPGGQVQRGKRAFFGRWVASFSPVIPNFQCASPCVSQNCRHI